MTQNDDGDEFPPELVADSSNPLPREIPGFPLAHPFVNSRQGSRSRRIMNIARIVPIIFQRFI